jgi:transcriptional regulator with XRE-family HTH domain
MNIGYKLLQLRLEKGWSQDYVAHKLGGISQSAYSKIENNAHPPSLKQLELISNLYEIEASEFFKSETNPTQINHNQAGGSATNCIYNPMEVIESAHNEAIAAKNETIQTLKNTILEQKDIILQLQLQLNKLNQ